MMNNSNQTPSLGRPRFKEQFQYIQENLKKQSRSYENSWSSEVHSADGKNWSSTQTNDSFDPRQTLPEQDWIHA